MNSRANGITALLQRISDPEIPAVNIVELGIVRQAIVEGESVTVEVTPTYSGCPAIDVIEREIIQLLTKEGYSQVRVLRVFSPPWTTDWLSDETKQKLRVAGISPPRSVSEGEVSFVPFSFGKKRSVSCPYCGAESGAQKSEFGPTPCTALYYCPNCAQPFEKMKEI